MVAGDSQDRLGDVYHPDFSDGRATYFDVYAVNTLQAGSISISSVAAREVAWRMSLESLSRSIPIAGSINIHAYHSELHQHPLFFRR